VADSCYALARISADQAQLFLERFANIPDDETKLRKFEKSFSKYVEGFAGQTIGEQLHQTEDPVASRIRDAQFVFLREDLRRRWNAQTTRERDVLISQLRTTFLNSVRSFMYRKSAGLLDTPGTVFLVPEEFRIPPYHPFEQVLNFLDKFGPRTRYCANPDCSERYFVADRRTGKYCSSDCAKPAQQALKRQWWNQHGSEWRRQRASKKQD
jgi:hypothetical protein